MKCKTSTNYNKLGKKGYRWLRWIRKIRWVWQVRLVEKVRHVKQGNCEETIKTIWSWKIMF